MLPALLTGQIDGFLHSEPTTTLAIVNNAGHLFMQAAHGDMGSSPPPATLMSSRRDYLQQNPDVARRFMRAIADANAAYAKAPAEMTSIVAEWSGQDEKIVHAAQERMNPTTHLTQAQAALVNLVKPHQATHQLLKMVITDKAAQTVATLRLPMTVNRRMCLPRLIQETRLQVQM